MANTRSLPRSATKSSSTHSCVPTAPNCGQASKSSILRSPTIRLRFSPRPANSKTGSETGAAAVLHGGLKRRDRILWAAVIFAATLQCAQAQPPPEVTMDVSTPINDFGLRLLRTLTDGSGKDVVVSPLSVSLALAMTCNGAAGDTRTSIAKTLGAESLTDEAINRNSRLLLDMVEKADPEAQMEVANALWTQSGFPINPDFLKLNRDYYDASVESLDFEGNPRNAANTINAWVNDKTHAHLRGGNSVSAPMMIETDSFPYFEDDIFQAIRLPYGNR